MRKRRQFPWGIFFFVVAPALGALLDWWGLWPPLAYAIGYSLTSVLLMLVWKMQGRI